MIEPGFSSAVNSNSCSTARVLSDEGRSAATDPHKWDPQTRETADHSIPFVVACALHFGSVYVEHFDEEVLLDPELLELMDKIEVHLDPECEAAWPNATLNIVTVEMTEGHRHTVGTPHYLGHFRRPMSDGDIEDKFRRLTQNLLAPKQQEEAVEIIWDLENVEDIGKVFGKLLV